ncbi:capreomycidine synthase [Streptacidiphilus sp. MAP12-20]|uniref:capreomycidine synthase n=1 Tax=Streptacidiphilus sp. MAP12-20 TaxID=3156299 RepID=UPI003514464B
MNSDSTHAADLQKAASQALGDIEPALLEDWFRSRYFDAKIDISSSGMQNYSLGQLRGMLGVSMDELDGLPFRDSPTLGCEPLRAAIAARYAPTRSERVMVTHGSTEGIFLALSAVVRPGDEVVVLSPVYQSLSSVASALGATLRVWELSPAEDFTPDLDRLAGLITAKTRAVVVNFPHNPTGAMLDPQGYHRLLEMVEAAGCYLFWDAAFGELVYDFTPLPDPAAIMEKCVSFGTMSKAFGLPGLRIGWCIAPPDVLATMVKLRDYVTISTSPLNELLATRVMENVDTVVGPLREQARFNRLLLSTWAADHPDLISLPLPHGGVSAFPALPRGVDTISLCDKLLDEHGVLLVPGLCFGHPDRVRLGFGGGTDELQAGLEAVAIAASELASPVAAY